MSFLGWLRSVVRDDEREALDLVRAADRRERSRERARVGRPAAEMAELAASPVPTITIGTSTTPEGRPFTVRLPEQEVRGGGHWFVTGATGSGKSYWAVSVILQLLRRRAGGLVVLDMKGELARDLREAWLPGLVAALDEEDAAALLPRIAMIAPFDSDALPPFQLLARDRNLPIELQAREVASSFGHTIGRDLGVLQSTILSYALLLAIDVGLTLPDVPGLLSDHARLHEAVGRTRLPEVRAYFANRFPRERSGSLVSLLSRLDTLLMHPTLREMLSAPGMIRFDRLIEDAVTIIDLGRAPAGMRELGRFFGSILFQKLVRAIFARRIERDTPPVTIIADEFQALLSPEIAGDFEAVLTQTRSQRAFLWLLCQQTAQVEAVSGTLLRILKTNSNYQLLFRANADDARALDHIFPVTGQIPRDRRGFADPRVPRATMPASEERRRIVDAVPNLPDRVFWFWNKRRPYRAILARSPNVSLEHALASAADLPDEVRGQIQRGVLAVSRRAAVARHVEPEAGTVPAAEESAPGELELNAPRVDGPDDGAALDSEPCAQEETTLAPPARDEAPAEAPTAEAIRPVRRRRGTRTPRLG